MRTLMIREYKEMSRMMRILHCQDVRFLFLATARRPHSASHNKIATLLLLLIERERRQRASEGDYSPTAAQEVEATHKSHP